MDYIIYISVITIFIQLFYVGLYIYSYFKIRNLHKDAQAEIDNSPTLSIIICAKNEFTNLKKYLDQVLCQDYPENKIQITVVNDGSTDQTSEWLNNLKLTHRNLNIIDIPIDEKKNLPGKKYALKKGIESVNSDYILLTDADCVPYSTSWAKQMLVAMKKSDSDIILGLGRYKYETDNWLNAFIQFETLHTAIQYASYTFIGSSYMGVGRNILYKTEVVKNAFNDPDLYEQFCKTNSGDDDLIITHAQKKGYKIRPYFAPEAQTISQPVSGLKEYYNQKTRHTSSSKYYTSSSKMLLGLYAISHLMFWLSSLYIIFTFVVSDFLSVGDKNLMIIFFIVLGLKLVNYQLWVSALKYKHNGLIYALLEPVWLLYNVILSPYIFWKNSSKWK